MGMWSNLMKQAEEDLKNKREMDKQGIVYCPRCKSTQITANKKGFGLGKALLGGVLTGGVGLLAGCIGKNKIECVCLKCGHKFKAGR